MSQESQQRPTSDRQPKDEKDAANLGRGGLYAPSGTPTGLALIQASAANVYHAYKAKEKLNGQA
jgi:hypothetical protein